MTNGKVHLQATDANRAACGRVLGEKTRDIGLVTCEKCLTSKEAVHMLGNALRTLHRTSR